MWSLHKGIFALANILDQISVEWVYPLTFDAGLKFSLPLIVMVKKFLWGTEICTPESCALPPSTDVSGFVTIGRSLGLYFQNHMSLYVPFFR